MIICQRRVMKNIVLVGFMGTGKTAVAKALASDLGEKYISIDEQIELREKKAIKDIFSEEGEPYFRKVEKEIVKELSHKSDQVLDAGGGVVLDRENIDNMEKNGIVICLWADVETVYERTSKHGHRPLLNVEDPMLRIKELMDNRRPFYEKAGHHIDTTELNVSEVVEKIKEIIGEEIE